MSTMILTYEFPPAIGGIGYYTYEVARGLFHAGEGVVVIAPGTAGDGEFDSKEGFKIVRVRKTLVIREMMMLVAALAAIRAQGIKRIFNSVWLPCGVISFLITRFVRIPYFVTAHGSDILDDQNIQNKLKHFVRRNLHWLKRLVLKHASRIFTVSGFTRDVLVDQRVPKDRIRVVLNGVDTVRFGPRPRSTEIMERHGLQDKKVILTVSRLDRYKGHDMVIRALPGVLQKYPETVYLIVGNGCESERLKDAVRELKLDRNVRFAGYVSDKELPDYYNSCDVFIMVPRQIKGDFEGFGLTYLEANACGKPVIGSRTGGVPEAVVDGETGIIVDPASAEKISAALIRIFSDSGLARRIGQAGRHRVERELNWSAVTGKLMNMMELEKEIAPSEE